jgi:hypothetical protein
MRVLILIEYVVNCGNLRRSTRFFGLSVVSRRSREDRETIILEVSAKL